ncbi:MAG: hypothetical protein KIS94_09475 [Chitinophagales bacterium]|nr:hypothetical protein [Chitinophagales bacterium]
MKQSRLIIVFIALLFSSCKKEDAQTYKVEYSIGCTNCMVVYISDQQGTQTTEHYKDSNWKYSFNAKKNQEVLLLAYNTASSHQSVTATIKLNEQVLKTQTSYCPVNGLSFCVDTIR